MTEISNQSIVSPVMSELSNQSSDSPDNSEISKSSTKKTKQNASSALPYSTAMVPIAASKKPRATNTALLPPCRICGEKATGFHYGAITCEACKGFFRRSLGRKNGYKCLEGKTCEIYGREKNQVKCPKCRFERCLEIGMSKEGMVHGRYTLETRTRYILEVKGQTEGPAQHKRPVNGFTQQHNSPAGQKQSKSPAVSSSRPRHTTDKAEPDQTQSNGHHVQVLTRGDDDSVNECSVNSASSLDTQTLAPMDTIDSVEWEDMRDTGISTNDCNNLGTCTTVDNQCDSLHARSPGTGGGVPLTDDEMQAIITNLMDTYWQHTDLTPECLAEMKSREGEFVEEHRVRQDIFGEMKPPSPAEYLSLRNTTGIEIDNRLLMIQRFSEVAPRIIGQIVNIVKAVPGFMEFCQEDQVCLVKNILKGGAHLIVHHKRYNLESGTIYGPRKQIVTDMKNTFTKIHGEETANLMINIIAKIKGLGLTDEEMLMSTSVCMLMADQYTLREPDKVARAHDTCLQCLLYLLRRNHPDEPLLLPRLTRVFTELRSLEVMRASPSQLEALYGCKFDPMLHEIFME